MALIHKYVPHRIGGDINLVLPICLADKTGKNMLLALFPELTFVDLVPFPASILWTNDKNSSESKSVD